MDPLREGRGSYKGSFRGSFIKGFYKGYLGVGFEVQGFGCLGLGLLRQLLELVTISVTGSKHHL